MTTSWLRDATLSSTGDVIGLDVGGANLKVATTNGACVSKPFEMWKRPNELGDAVFDLLKSLLIEHQQVTQTAKPPARLAVTMTGELADCFYDREIGVKHIIDHVVVAATRLNTREVRFYGVDGEFHGPEEARLLIDKIAAANWHAMGTYWARRFNGRGLLVDIGSSTTDIIPLMNAEVATSSQTDFDRLGTGELVYVGCQRTPVCGLVDQLTVCDGGLERAVAVMNEVFATMDDVMLVLGSQTEVGESRETADGQPRTVAASTNRLARMVGLDHRSVDSILARDMAKQILRSAQNRIASAIASVLGSGSIGPSKQSLTLVLAGHGCGLLDLDALPAMLGMRSLNVIRVEEVADAMTSRIGPAHAVAKLMRDSCVSNPK